MLPRTIRLNLDTCITLEASYNVKMAWIRKAKEMDILEWHISENKPCTESESSNNRLNQCDLAQRQPRTSTHAVTAVAVSIATHQPK